jgi:hypothetical protein
MFKKKIKGLSKGFFFANFFGVSRTFWSKNLQFGELLFPVQKNRGVIDRFPKVQVFWC